MRLTETIKKWLTEQNMSEEPEVNEDGSSSSTHFTYRVGEFLLPCYLDADEEKELCQFYAYYREPTIPEGRVHEVKRLLHKMNSGKLKLGVVQLIDDDHAIRYYSAIDVENASFETAHISNIVFAGLDFMEYILPKHLAICFSDGTTEAAFLTTH